MNTPYKTKTGILIGSNYFPIVNYHNSDQDWIQRVALGEKKYWDLDTVVSFTLWVVVFYAVTGLLSGCGTTQTVPVAYSYSTAPVVPIVLDPRAEQLTRQQVIQGINDCESNQMRAVVVTSKRMISGFTSEIPIDVQCYPKRTIY